MKRSSAPVKPAGQTGDTQELARKRIARREAVYEKLCTTIERTQRKLEKADKTAARCVRLLAKLERQRSRTRKALEAAKTAATNDLVQEATPEPAPKMVRAATPEPAPGRLIVNDPTDGYVPAPKPKRTRKKAETFEVGNQVRVSEAADATIFEIVRLEPDGSCFIREEGLVNGKPYVEQCSHTSLLKHAVTDEMLKAFSWGKLKAGRKTKLSV